MKWLLFISSIILSNTLAGQERFDTSLYISAHDIHFETNRWDIQAQDSVFLDSLIAMGIEYDSLTFSIHAHTDDVGQDEFNIDLSRSRAESTRQFLLRRSIDPASIEISFHGESQLKINETTEEARSINRRATVKMYYVKTLQWVTGLVKDEDSGMGVIAKVKLHSKTFKNETNSDSSGQFSIKAPIDEVVGIDVVSKGYLIETEMLKVKPKLAFEPLEFDMPVIAVGKQFEMSNLYFEGNKNILRKKSFDKIGELYDFMQLNDDHCIEIAGHVNHPGKNVKSDSWSYHLSIARAKRIHDMLIEQSIDTSRVLFKGYGNWEMVFPNPHIELQMAKNRRVEFRIIDCARALSEADDIVNDEFEFESGLQPTRLNNRKG